MNEQQFADKIQNHPDGEKLMNELSSLLLNITFSQSTNDRLEIAAKIAELMKKIETMPSVSEMN